ncbi:RING-like domain-containing protein [Xylariales sp. PMI_506]|nr:RING-like domain-containing protein [Xylariales sp. PMI_506]
MADEDSVPVNYNDGNRAFLQALMSRGTVTVREAKPILAAIMTAQRPRQEPVTPDQVTEADFEAHIGAAQEALSHFDYDLRSTMHQVRKERVWAVVNTTSDPLTQLATLHSPEEIAFVKRILDAMFEKYNTQRMEVMCVDSMQANKFRSAPRVSSGDDLVVEDDTQAQTQSLKGLKSSEVESVMQAMVDGGWFELSGDGFYGLTPRGLLELRSWLIDSYNDPDAEPDEWQRIKFCEACKEIVTAGQRCAERDCIVRLHDICEDAFWRTRREKTCPKCTTAWTGRHFVGPKAVTETDAYKRRKSGRSRGSLIEQVMQDEGEEVDGD